MPSLSTNNIKKCTIIRNKSPTLLGNKTLLELFYTHSSRYNFDSIVKAVVKIKKTIEWFH